METKEHVTLLELNRLVREVIESEMPNEYWVEAELSECRESRGHCYMELVQKDEQHRKQHAQNTSARSQTPPFFLRFLLRCSFHNRLSSCLPVCGSPRQIDIVYCIAFWRLLQAFAAQFGTFCAIAASAPLRTL